MKKSFLVWIIQLVTMPALSQQIEFRKNTLSFETGIYHHGLLGLSYGRNFLETKNSFCAVEFAGGAGIGWDGVNRYLSLSPSVNLGEDRTFFIAGLDVKYYYVSLHHGNHDLFGWWYEIDPFPHYEGISVSPVLGINHQARKGFSFKMKLSALTIFEDWQLEKTRPSVGFSFGYSF